MAFKFVALFAFIAVASAVEYHHQPQYHQQPQYQAYHAQPQAYHAQPAIIKTLAAPVYKHVEYEHEAPAEYDFSYSVHDEHTGDVKSQQETRKGDAVQGSYSLIDADGFKRTVDYTADDHHGFNAVVRREPLGHKVAQYAPVAKVIAAPVHYQPAQQYHQAPQYTKVVAPVHYQPAQQYHQAPVHYQPAQQYHQAPQYTKVVAPVVAKIVAPVHYQPAQQYHQYQPAQQYQAPAYNNYHH